MNVNEQTNANAQTMKTPPPPPVISGKRSLVTKLAEVMGVIERIPKSGHNAHFNYDFATEADIVAAVRKGMAERNLMLVPSVEKTEWEKLATSRSGAEQKLCTLTVLFTVIDGETGEKLEFRCLGQGSDGSDKATYKAMTGAVKYALLKLFLIPTGDDPEKDEKHGEVPTHARPPPAPPKSAAPSPAPAASKAQTQEEQTAAAHAARAGRIWARAQNAAMDKESFGKWTKSVLGHELPSRAWKPEEMKRLEDALEALEPPPSAAPPKSPPPKPAGEEVTMSFGRSKGIPLSKLSDKDLAWYAEALAKNVADPEKARWRDDNTAALTAIRDEQDRRK